MALLQARATPRKRAPAGTSEAQPTPWSVVEHRAQQQDLPEPDTQGHDSMDAGPMQVQAASLDWQVVICMRDRASAAAMQAMQELCR